ncbi:MAG: 50S ribosomal protein L25 [Deltaproteobacteria bacterium]|nr:50S ribosomal protein L25 [Deltaproteobacteria bacterium]
MDIPVLKVEPREVKGKGPSAKMRRQGRIPAICYGKAKEAISLTVDPIELVSILRGPRGMNSLIKLEGSSDDRTVFVQELQKHPVERDILHVDFIHVDPNKAIVRSVPVEFVGKSEGVKLGGVLQVTMREIQVETLPATELPDGVKALFDRNYSICAVVAPTEEKEEEKPEEEEGEGLEAAEGEEGAAEAKEGDETKEGDEKKEEGAADQGKKPDGKKK